MNPPLSLSEEVEQIMWPLPLGPDLLYECQSCGAVVTLRFTHVEWHREQDERR